MRSASRRTAVAALCLLLSVTATVHAKSALAAPDATSAASVLSDQAFALLGTVTSNPAGKDLVGPVAGFAGDAQILANALKSGDSKAATDALFQLRLDRKSVDEAAKAHPGIIDSANWEALKQRLTTLAARVSPGSAGANAHTLSAAARSAASLGPAATRADDGPKVVIESRGDGHHIKGWFEGSSLTSAGIYIGSRKLESLKVRRHLGEQRVNFELNLEGPTSGMVVRVYDAAGRSAEAPIASAAGSSVPAAPAESASAPEALGPPAAEPMPEVLRNGNPGNTAEIPSHGSIARSSASRSRTEDRTGGGRLANVHITIVGVTPADATGHRYQVIGQISGKGVRRAGVYVDGHLARRIPLDRGASFSGFDVTFVMNGSDATIRVYGHGDRFVESSINLQSSALAAGDSAPFGMVPNSNPDQISVAIASIRRVSRNLIVVTGVISGRNISSAAVYQNGMPVQALPVSGGLLGALISGSYRQVNFTARFNGSAGPATIRVFNTSGMAFDQPIGTGGGMFGSYPSYAPYSPYAQPFGYGPNPYRRYPNPPGGSPPLGPPPGTW